MRWISLLAASAVALTSASAMAQTKIDFFFPVPVDGKLAKELQRLTKVYNESQKDVAVTPVYAGNYDDAKLKAQAAAAAGKPFIFLSAGVGNAQFTESLKMASEAGIDYCGVLCGRATWKEGIPVYAKQGLKALEDWLLREGVKNINAVNDAIQSATPWYSKMGVAARP